MGFMGTGKSAEDKALEKLATYLENMDLRPKDGKQGYEILDVQLSPSGMGDSLLCCLVLITYK